LAPSMAWGLCAGVVVVPRAGPDSISLLMSTPGGHQVVV
jgi:hypothetical protein